VPLWWVLSRYGSQLGCRLVPVSHPRRSHTTWPWHAHSVRCMELRTSSRFVKSVGEPLVLVARSLFDLIGRAPPEGEAIGDTGRTRSVGVIKIKVSRVGWVETFVHRASWRARCAADSSQVMEWISGCVRRPTIHVARWVMHVCRCSRSTPAN